MSWQLCPACNGQGIDMITPVSSGINPCPVCKGERIIDEVTGKPPSSEISKSPVSPGAILIFRLAIIVIVTAAFFVLRGDIL